MRSIANFFQAGDYKFGESLLVADFVDEFMRAEEYARLAKGSESENRTYRQIRAGLSSWTEAYSTVGIGQSLEAVQWDFGLDFKEVADNRDTLWCRDGDLRAHCDG